MALVSLLVGMASLVASPLAMTSPWWENYDIKERFLCAGRGDLVVERNDSQASLFSGASRVTLFREASDDGAQIYRNAEIKLILRGDELTLERLPMQLTCLRSEEV